ncbi:GGDEF domain-containing protein [Nocardioides dilutus]
MGQREQEAGTSVVDQLRDAVQRVDALLREDARAALELAREHLDRTETGADGVDYQSLLLLKGAAQARIGETEDGARLMREVKAWAEDHGETFLVARSHRRLSALFRRVGDPALMLEHAVAAVELLGPDAEEDIRADHLLCLADALGAGGDYAASIARYEECADLLARCEDPIMRSAWLNNFAFTQFEAGLIDQALVTAETLRADAAAEGRDLMAHDCDTIARIYMAVGRLDEAIEVLVPVCSAEAAGEDCDGRVLALLALTEVYRLGGRLDAAQAALDQCFELIDQYALTGRRAEAQHELAGLAAARGDYQAAYEAFREFHEAEARLRALQREAQARTMHAIFEATEARRASEHFRELSVRDPLTGLRNRRGLDGWIEELLGTACDDGSGVTVGLIDLDHFKRINDTISHAVGDEVLRVVAGLLDYAALGVDGGVAARVGGEEFLLVLPVGRAEGIKRLDSLRREIAIHPWSEVATGVAVTASIGVATSPEDGIDRAALLSLADARLHSAKRGGRNRVIS